MNTEQNFQQLNLDRLVPFSNHPFKLYEGQRLTDMVMSVRENGVITPIVVRPADDGKYEILSGHNRVKAAEEAGLESIPAVIRDDLKDDDEKAMLIVTLTNLQQRSFGDCTYDALKHQGQRNDLREIVDSLVDGDKLLSDVRKKLTPKEMLANQLGLTENNIACYLRLNKLVNEMLELLDNGEIDLSIAEKLTYLSTRNQKVVLKVMAKERTRITMNKARELVNAQKEADFPSEKIIKNILVYKQERKLSYKVKDEIFEKYFSDKEPGAIDEIIAQALEMWEKSKNEQ